MTGEPDSIFIHGAWAVPALTDPTFLLVAYVRPWEVPDHLVWPTFTPCPRVQRWQDRVTFWRGRASDALDVLRHGLPDDDDW